MSFKKKLKKTDHFIINEKGITALNFEIIMPEIYFLAQSYIECLQLASYCTVLKHTVHSTVYRFYSAYCTVYSRLCFV